MSSELGAVSPPTVKIGSSIVIVVELTVVVAPLTVKLPETVKLSSTVTVPPAESITKFPLDVSISPSAVTPTLILPAVIPATVGLELVSIDIVGVAPSPELLARVIPVPATRLVTYEPVVSVPRITPLSLIVTTPELTAKLSELNWAIPLH